LRKIRLPFAIGSLLILASTCANVAAALLLKPLFDNAVLGTGDNLWTILATQLSLFLTYGALAGVAFEIFARASATLGNQITEKLYASLERRPLSYFLDKPRSEVLQLLRNDVLVLELNFGHTAGQALVATFQTIVTLTVILWWQPKLAFFCILGLGASAGLIWLSSHLTNHAMEKEIAANEAVAEHLLATLGVRGFLLRASASARWARARLQTLLAVYRRALVKRRVVPNWILVGGEQLSTITFFGFYLAGAYMVSDGQATTGELIAMAAVVSYLVGSLNQLAPTYLSLGDALLRVKRVELELGDSVIRNPPSQLRVCNSLSGLFEVKNVTVSYGGTLALDNVSLSIEPGRISGIIGESGAGKTTLALLLLGVLSPDNGLVLIDDVAIDEYDRESLWRQIGFVPQEPILFAGSIKENVAAGRPLSNDDIAMALRSAAVDGQFLPSHAGENGAGQDGFRLSAGERQRIGLARALAGKPPVLIVDEPTANLDRNTERKITDALLVEKMKGHTIVIITHSVDVLTICDRVAVLHRGRLTAMGARDCPAIQKYVSEHSNVIR
jgi:ABC-type multidrug transport system fused ATPase/permease subunit